MATDDKCLSYAAALLKKECELGESKLGRGSDAAETLADLELGHAIDSLSNFDDLLVDWIKNYVKDPCTACRDPDRLREK